VFVLWTPVLPRWIGRVPAFDLRFPTVSALPDSIVWGGVEEAVEVRAADETEGLRRFRLALADGSELEVAGTPGDWRRIREEAD
jgi:hypothetical protein